MRTVLTLLTIVVGLLTSGCSLIGLGIGAAIPRYAETDPSTSLVTSDGAAIDGKPLVADDSVPRVRFDTPASVSDIKQAACTTGPVLGRPIAVMVEEAGAHTDCGSLDAAARHVSVRLKTVGASSVIVELDSSSRSADFVEDQQLVEEASKRIQRACVPTSHPATHRDGSYWATGLAVGIVLDVVTVIAGGIAVATAMANWSLGFPSGGLGGF